MTVVCPPLSGWFSEPLAQSHPELGRGCVKMCIPLGMDAYMWCCPALSLLVPGSPSSFPCFCFLLPRDSHRRCLLCLLALSGRQVTPSDGLPDILNSGSQKHRKKRFPRRPVYEFPPLKTPPLCLWLNQMLISVSCFCLPCCDKVSRRKATWWRNDLLCFIIPGHNCQRGELMWAEI